MRTPAATASPVMVALAIVVALTATACGAAKTAGADAGTDVGSREDSAPDVSGSGCEPALQNCSAGSECDFGCQGSTALVACRPDNGDGGVGTACSGNMPCQRGSACLGLPDGGVVCRKYCAADGDCPTGERCHNASVGIACAGTTTSLPLQFCY